MTTPTPFAGRAAALFDLDGLLVDSEPLWTEAIAAVVAAFGGTYNAALAEAHRGCRLPDVVRILIDGCGMRRAPAPAALGDALVEDLLGRFDRLVALPGAAAALARARAAVGRVALATSSRQRIATAALAALRWVDGFDAVVTGDDVAAGKPAPDIFLLAAARLGLDPAAPRTDCVVFEDSVNGVRAALAAGMACVAVPAATDRAAVAALRPQFLLHSLAELG